MKKATRKPTTDGKDILKLKRAPSDDQLSTKSDEKPRSSLKTYTPRDYLKKPTASDVYGRKPKPATSRDRLKSTSTTSLTLKPVIKTKTDLKASASKTSDVKSKSVTRAKNEPAISKIKTTHAGKLGKDLPVLNVTVNSPPTERKLDRTKNNKLKDEDNVNSNYVQPKRRIEKENSELVYDRLPRSSNDNERIRDKVTIEQKETRKEPPNKTNYNEGDAKSEDTKGRARKNTRTLKDNEIKLLTDELVDNNQEMINLKHKLSAKPKAFFVDLDNPDQKSKIEEVKSEVGDSNSNDEDSYEDDFESYASDFESYCSSGNESNSSDSSNSNEVLVEKKSNSDEERMLDSGSFELREAQKSANKAKATIMDGISEDLEDPNVDKHRSLPDEGFLDMSNSSGVTHFEILENTLFVNFSKSKQNRKRSDLNEKLKQRAKDLLSMITLHEISFHLFELKPIPYEVYMSTFGNSNYTQKVTQTFDDGIDVECQTEEVEMTTKWTQNPVKFSKNDVYLNDFKVIKRSTNSVEDFVSKFTNLVAEKSKDIEPDSDYKNNPLRVYLEQKDGVGDDAMLPMKKYTSKINDVQFNYSRLVRFLKRKENIIFNALSGRKMDDFTLKSNLTFSKGFKTVHLSNDLLKSRKILAITYSESHTNVFATVHERNTDKCLVCLWDISSCLAPKKMLVAIDNIVLCKLRGSFNEGIFVAALKDGSIHLWDLSEQPTWYDMTDRQATKKPNTDVANKTQTELDREWNEQNNSNDEMSPGQLFSASSFTSSPLILSETVHLDDIVALEFTPFGKIINMDGRRILGQVCSLQRKGLLTIWNIIEERKQEKHEIGKAYWSRVKLEKHQTVSLLEQSGIQNGGSKFNLNLAKKRILLKRTDSDVGKKRRNTKIEFGVANNKKENHEPMVGKNLKKELGVANTNTVLQDENIYPESWELGILCYDLKILFDNNIHNYLIAKNCGEVLSCIKNINGYKIQCYNVADITTTVTTLQVARHRLQILCGTDNGLIHLYSIEESRALLTLDNRSISYVPSPSDPQADMKGRYIGSVPVKPKIYVDSDCSNMLKVKCIQWSSANPCCIFTLSNCGVVSEWNLMESDIRPIGISPQGNVIQNIILNQDHMDPTMAILPEDNLIQIHLLKNKGLKKNNEMHVVFDKYVRLL